MELTEMIASDDTTEPSLEFTNFEILYLLVASRHRVALLYQIIMTNLNFTSRDKVQASRRFGQIMFNFNRVLQFNRINYEPQHRRHSYI